MSKKTKLELTWIGKENRSIVAFSWDLERQRREDIPAWGIAPGLGYKEGLSPEGAQYRYWQMITSPLQGSKYIKPPIPGAMPQAGIFAPLWGSNLKVPSASWLFGFA